MKRSQKTLREPTFDGFFDTLCTFDAETGDNSHVATTFLEAVKDPEEGFILRDKRDLDEAHLADRNGI